MERIPNDSTNRVIFFVAVDAVDLYTRETGLSSFTVNYVLDNGTRGVMTTPTTAAIDDTNLPGLYSLLIDEAAMTNMDAANDEEILTLHITHASIEPITMKVSVYRPKITEGNTAAVSAGGVVDANVKTTDDINLSAKQKTDVNAEVDTALSDINLDHLLKVAKDTNWATTVTKESVLDLITSKDTDQTYARARDSAEAIRDKLPTNLEDLAVTDTTGIVNATVSDKTGFSLSTAGILAVWHQAISAIVTASTIGKKLVDILVGADGAVKISTDTADLSGSLSVNAKLLGGATPNNLSSADARDAIFAKTGITAGGTWTFAKLLKIMSAWAAGKWKDKTGVAGTYQVLDAEDGSTVIAEVKVSETTPQKEVTIL